MDSTALIAGYAALVSTGQLLWKIYEWRRDNAGLKLAIKWAIFDPKFHPSEMRLIVSKSEQGSHIAFEVTNRTHMRLGVHEYGLCDSKKKVTVEPLSNETRLPLIVEPLSSGSLLAPLGIASEGIRLLDRRTAKAYVIDSMGRMCKCGLPAQMRGYLSTTVVADPR